MFATWLVASTWTAIVLMGLVVGFGFDLHPKL
jgi:hypothetical protein